MIRAALDVTQLWRGFCITECAVAMGMAALLTHKYLHIVRHRRSNVAYGILGVSMSFVMLCAYVVVDHLHRLIDGEPFTFRLVLGPISYTLAIWAAGHLIKAIRDVERADHPKRRSYDPLNKEG